MNNADNQIYYLTINLKTKLEETHEKKLLHQYKITILKRYKDSKNSYVFILYATCTNFVHFLLELEHTEKTSANIELLDKFFRDSPHQFVWLK